MQKVKKINVIISKLWLLGFSCVYLCVTILAPHLHHN